MQRLSWRSDSASGPDPGLLLPCPAASLQKMEDEGGPLLENDLAAEVDGTSWKGLGEHICGLAGHGGCTRAVSSGRQAWEHLLERSL